MKYMKGQHKKYLYRMQQKNYNHPATHISTRSASHFRTREECMYQNLCTLSLTLEKKAVKKFDANTAHR